MKEIVLATRNPDKIREIKELLKGLNITLPSLKDFPQIPETIEDEGSLEGNALKKASSIATLTGKTALADDSGLEVDALGGSPGVSSSCLAGKKATYSQNNRKLLSLLKSIPPKKRGARFRCVIALVTPNGKRAIFEGICEGRVAREERGKEGFGYDPLFIPKGYRRTFGEMPSSLKNTLSHRAKALKRLKRFLSRQKVDIRGKE